jgi:hypothetical protein
VLSISPPQALLRTDCFVFSARFRERLQVHPVAVDTPILRSKCRFTSPNRTDSGGTPPTHGNAEMGCNDPVPILSLYESTRSEHHSGRSPWCTVPTYIDCTVQAHPLLQREPASRTASRTEVFMDYFISTDRKTRFVLYFGQFLLLVNSSRSACLVMLFLAEDGAEEIQEAFDHHSYQVD